MSDSFYRIRRRIVIRRRLRPPLHTSRALPVAANVYLMARQFDTLGGTIAASLVISTALAAATTPLLVALTAAG